MRLVQAPFVVGILGSATWASLVHGECPSSSVKFFNSPPLTVTASAYDSTYNLSPLILQRATFDLAAGYLEMAQNSTIGAGLELRTMDDFRLTGAMADVGHAISAVLHVAGSVDGNCGFHCGYASVEIEWSDDSGGVRRFAIDTAPSGSDSGVEDLVLPLIVRTDQTFRLSARATASTNGCCSSIFGRAYLGAQLRFEGLPPGSVVESCHGFTSDGPVPVETHSWGSLKARYR